MEEQEAARVSVFYLPPTTAGGCEKEPNQTEMAEKMCQQAPKELRWLFGVWQTI